MSRKSTTSFQSNLSKLGRGKAIGVQHDNPLHGFNPWSPINFGKPSSLKSLASTSNSGSTDWGGLAKQVVSGGASSLFGSGSANALFGGLGSLISGIASLFGGGHQKTLPALNLFQLPQAVNQTVHMQSAAPAAGSAVHVHVQAMDTQSFVNRSSDIARAVKTAMLNSHSLNDVVSEL